MRGRPEVIDSKGCSRLFVGTSSSLPSFSRFEPISPASSIVSQSPMVIPPTRPFAGLVICVTGLSKEARKQVMDATERLGGQYSPNLHSQCTHLVVQSYGGRKFEHALKHGSRNGLYIVTLGWFVDSVRRNVRLSEAHYTVKHVGEADGHYDELNRLFGFTGTENSCFPVGILENFKQSNMMEGPNKSYYGRESRESMEESTLSGHSIFIDSEISDELRTKVVKAAVGEGATIFDEWYVGCSASHVVCEGPSIRKYIGHSNTCVTPLWILKTAKERHKQNLCHISADMARHIGVMLENFQSGIAWGEVIKVDDCPIDALISRRSKLSHEERKQIVELAKVGVRNRRGRYMHRYQIPIRQITSSSLLDAICWTISEPTSTVSIYADSRRGEDISEDHVCSFSDAGNGRDSEASFVNFSRPLTDSEKNDLIFKHHFLTILFPVDRFGEIGPFSRTFFSDKGFTCLQVLDHIYAFYQENMSAPEVEVAIHTDSRHADRIRSVYSSNETEEGDYIGFKRIDFLGSRKSFEMLKRVSGDNNNNVYELLIRA